MDSLAPMAGLAVEVWTTNAAIHFDNFLVSRSTSAASDYAAKTFKLVERVSSSFLFLYSSLKNT
jgi:chromosomal replication initiation ATPase DnaA